MTNRICSMCMQLHSKAEILNLLEEQKGKQWKKIEIKLLKNLWKKNQKG